MAGETARASFVVDSIPLAEKIKIEAPPKKKAPSKKAAKKKARDQEVKDEKPGADGPKQSKPTQQTFFDL